MLISIKYLLIVYLQNALHNFYIGEEQKMKKTFAYTLLFLLSVSTIAACSTTSNNYCTVTFDSNGGTLIESQKVKHGDKVEKPDDPIKEGHTFVNWTYKGEEWSFIGYSVTENMTLLANWTANSYELTVSCEEHTISDPYGHTWQYIGGQISGAESGIYEYGTDLTVIASPEEYFVFVGWFDENNQLVSDQATYNFKMGLSKSLIAKFDTEPQLKPTPKYQFTLSTESPSKGTVRIVERELDDGQLFDRIELVTIEATPNPGYVFKGWYDGLVLASKKEKYTFTMRFSDYALTAYFCVLDELWKADYDETPTLKDEKTITYGLYPQTNVSDTSVINSLNSLSPRDSNINGWYRYNGEYYVPSIAYRCLNGYQYWFSNGIYAEQGIRYWFKCEPVDWDIVKSSSSSYSLVTNMLLNAHQLVDCYEQRPTSSLGEIDRWLREELYYEMFGFNESYIIDNVTKMEQLPSSYFDQTGFNAKCEMSDYDTIISMDNYLSYEYLTKDDYIIDGRNGSKYYRNISDFSLVSYRYFSSHVYQIRPVIEIRK